MERLARIAMVALLFVGGSAQGDEPRLMPAYREAKDAARRGDHAAAVRLFSVAYEQASDPGHKQKIAELKAQSESALAKSGKSAPPPPLPESPPPVKPTGSSPPRGGSPSIPPPPKDTSDVTRPSPPPDVPPNPPRPSPRLIAGGVGLGVAGLLVVGGIAATAVNSETLAVWNDDSKCLYKDVLRTRGEQCAGEKTTLDLTRSLAIASFAVGGALAITSIVLLVLKPQDKKLARLDCGRGPGEFGITCAGAF